MKNLIRTLPYASLASIFRLIINHFVKCKSGVCLLMVLAVSSITKGVLGRQRDVHHVSFFYILTSLFIWAF